ncbi:hypothetical protein QBC42DRAFT_293648 [Cladorrhinum samala]|uniref:Zn(2)-C6 fungal-type domain-containing protein n=1 Tax=Cladorrhinum samala TaxID=585594 RepID=A0AAV9HYR1_9PEZI|nr:hypothetical protein QBC42DRAFT_293648 [Cladorrhinum samala]
MMPPKDHPQKRSRTGCITCRIRRVKCDEAQPSCQRCVSAKRQCDGYINTASAVGSSSSSSPSSSSGRHHHHLSSRALAAAVRRLHVIGPASRVLGPAVPTHESSCFDFFRVCTSQMTASVFPAPFWSRQVLQVSHSEPAAWKAAVAVGALHRRWERCSGSSPSTSSFSRLINGGGGLAGGSGRDQEEVEIFTRQAVVHYCGAISLAKTVRDPRVLVVVSAVLAAAANMAGRWADSQVHIRSGMRLLEGMSTTQGQGQGQGRGQGSRKGPGEMEMESVAHALARLDLQAMLFNDSRAEYKYVDEDGRILNDGLAGMMTVPEQRLDDLTQASTVIFGLMRYYFTMMAAGGMGFVAPEEVGEIHLRVVDEAAKWERELDRLVGELEQSDAAPRRRTEEDEEKVLATERAVLSLRLYSATFSLLLSAGVAGPEGRWDAHQATFDRIVALAQDLEDKTKSPLPFFMSLEPGIVMPLFLVAIRCRHPVTRRRALDLLRRLKRQEGLWSSSGAAVVAAQVILAEEENMPSCWTNPQVCQTLVPEELRICRNAVIVDAEVNQIQLSLYRNHVDGSGEYLARDVILTF